jgi:hypothetical protein
VEAVNTATLPLDEAIGRIRTDHEILLAHVTAQSDITLVAGPLGDSCESLHDLVAHVLMWDEIALAVLAEANAGREHWSLDARWTTPDAGRRLNRGGVLAGRELPSELLLHRLGTVRDAFLAEVAGYNDEIWRSGRGDLTQYVCTVPGKPSFWHAALHLNAVPTDW